MSPISRSVGVAVLVAAALAPATASADSIVFTKDANVWVAAPDGSAQRAVTADGTAASPYSDPSQADDGTILARRGTRLVRLDRQGNALAPAMPTVLTNKPANVNAVGPFDPQISPDGTKVAYWIGVYSSWHDYGSNIEWTSNGPAVVWQDARDGSQLGATQFYEEPSWLADSSRALLFEETNALAAQVVVAGVGQNHNDIQQWFGDYDTKPQDEEYSKPISGGELSRDGSKLAMLRAGTNLGNGGMSHGAGNTIRLYGASGFGAAPQMWWCGVVDAVGGEFDDPTWSPRGDGLAWAEGDGIWSTPVGGDCATPLAPRRVIEGGRDPDWGPADAGPAAPPAPDPGGGRVQQSGDPVHQIAPPVLSAPRSIKRGALRRRGLVANVDCDAACAVTATLRSGPRRVASATGSTAAAGRVALRLRPKGRVGRRLKLSVKVGAETLTRRIAVR